jgi:hypothetical protein
MGKFEIRNQKLTVLEGEKMGGLSRFARLEGLAREFVLGCPLWRPVSNFPYDHVRQKGVKRNGTADLTGRGGKNAWTGGADDL